MAYPNPLISSGQLSLLDIYDWMVAAGEWPNTLNGLPFTYIPSLDVAVTHSHLTDKATPYNISNFYGYAILPTYYEHILTTTSYANSGDACLYGIPDRTVYTYPSDPTLAERVTIYTDTALSSPIATGMYIGSDYRWIEIDAGVIISIGFCESL